MTTNNVSDTLEPANFENIACPLPHPTDAQILLGHGSGGTLTQQLIQDVFMKYLHSESLSQGDDSAVLPLDAQKMSLAISTDSHIVKPLFFPGADIGRLAICGTVNDLLANGAIPHWLSAAFILEEGFLIADLERILDSMRNAAIEAGVEIVCGDTKVVERGKGDGVFINTTGIGIVTDNFRPAGCKAKSDDVVIISGSVGDHGITVLLAQGGLGISAEIASDAAPLTAIVDQLRPFGNQIHVLRDPTRGGLSTALNEIAQQSNVTIELDEEMIPITAETASVCELIGFDPLWAANEGKMIIICTPQCASDVLEAVRQAPYGQNAAIIGKVSPTKGYGVCMRTALGSTRILDSLPGELLPRIC